MLIETAVKGLFFQKNIKSEKREWFVSQDLEIVFDGEKSKNQTSNNRRSSRNYTGRKRSLARRY